jgi:hypothetical protein
MGGFVGLALALLLVLGTAHERILQGVFRTGSGVCAYGDLNGAVPH